MVNRYYSSTAVDTTLTNSISSSDTTMVVGATTGFPTSYPYTLAVGYDLSSEELVNVVGASGTTLTLGTTVGVASTSGRGVDGTTAQSHASAVSVKHVITARDMTEAQAHIAATTSVHGITDTSTLVTLTGTGTLTNKTLTSPNINSAVISGGSITGSISSGATLTGGTINGAQITNTTYTSGTITGSISGSPTFTGTVVLPSTTTIGNVSSTELGYVDGVTSAIQTQINTKASLSGTETLTNKTIAAVNYYEAQAAPTSLGGSGSVTLTIAQLLNGLFVSGSGGGYTYTLPTGTDADNGSLSGSLPIDYAFDWSLINTAGSAVTIAGNTGHTVISGPNGSGPISCPLGSQVMLRSRKTANNTFVTYRIA